LDLPGAIYGYHLKTLAGHIDKNSNYEIRWRVTHHNLRLKYQSPELDFLSLPWGFDNFPYDIFRYGAALHLKQRMTCEDEPFHIISREYVEKNQNFKYIRSN